MKAPMGLRCRPRRIHLLNNCKFMKNFSPTSLSFLPQTLTNERIVFFSIPPPILLAVDMEPNRLFHSSVTLNSNRVLFDFDV